MTFVYRPSGPFRWMLEKFSSISEWSLVGSISAEERSLAAISELSLIGKLDHLSCLRIEPSSGRKPNRFRSEIMRKLNTRQRETEGIVGVGLLCTTVDLLCREEDLIRAIRDCLSPCGPNLVLDISSMPKRFFFPLIALAIRSGNFENILVSYSSPKSYGEPLAEDPLPWSALPTFGATDLSKDGKLIIGVGYQSLRLHEIVDGVLNPDNVELLLPFPSVHPGFTKNWEFVRKIRMQIDRLQERSIKRVPAKNTSIAFDRIVGSSNRGANPCKLAPFGPKPVSLAMCLFGVCCQDKNIPVELGYTQPQVYSDKYSVGIAAGIDGNPIIHAYAIKLNGHSLYQF